jgi:hypothetical protein
LCALARHFFLPEFEVRSHWSLIAPAPAPNGNSFLSVFKGQNPNGVWELWVLDDTDDDTGKIAGGWSLEITAEVDA